MENIPFVGGGAEGGLKRLPFGGGLLTGISDAVRKPFLCDPPGPGLGLAPVIRLA